jgi:hypothetical protein
MPEIDEELELEVDPTTMTLTTHTNGDRIHIRNIDMTKGQVATLAWLINHAPEEILEVHIKVKP